MFKINKFLINNKIKIFFLISVLIFTFLLIYGISIIKNNYYFIIDYTIRIFYLFKYKIEFIIYNNSIFLRDIDNGAYARSIPVLLYHGIIKNSDGSNVLLEDFKSQMFALKKAGWQTINIEDFYQFMKREKTLPNKSFLLTFDDGRKDSYYPVDPILKALDYNAVIFIITKYSFGDKSENFYLSKKELQRMVKSGRWEIETHTQEGHDMYKISQDGKQGHFYTNKLWIDSENRLETEEEFTNRIKSDFIIAKNNIERELGTKIISIAFPFGDFGQNTVNFPKAKNIILNEIKLPYSIFFYQDRGDDTRTNYPQNNQNFLIINRINVTGQFNVEDLFTAIENNRAKILPYYNVDFKKNIGWQKSWGILDFKDNSMIISSDSSRFGSAVFLKSTYFWENYFFKSNIYLTNGQSFALMGRYQDGNNYAACLFSNDFMTIEQFLNGERKILSELRGDFKFSGKNRMAGIKVYDNTINCYLDDKIVIKDYNLDQSLNHGGIGFKTWDSQVNNSKLIVKSISVEEIK